MNEYQVMQLISSTGVNDTEMSCDQLTRLYARKLSELSEHLNHDDLLELLAFGSLLYGRAFQEFKARSQMRDEGGIVTSVQTQKRPAKSRHSMRVVIDEDDSLSVVRAKALRLERVGKT